MFLIARVLLIAQHGSGRHRKLCRRRHLNSWLLFTSWRHATIDTDAPAHLRLSHHLALQRLRILSALRRARLLSVH
jgi:hypothetical protein